jgi:hypothetical protein
MESRSNSNVEGVKSPWCQAPLVYSILASCPSCGAPAIGRHRVLVKCTRLPNGASERWCLCRECSVRYRVIAVVPKNGISPEDNVDEPRIGRNSEPSNASDP